MTAPLPGWLASAARVTVLTGAGISTDSGIPDFRAVGPGGSGCTTRPGPLGPTPATPRWSSWSGRAGCGRCGGILKSATISFGQALDAAVVEAAVEAAADCDVFLVVGTSLTVHPAAGLVDLAAAHGARVVVVNAEPTRYDGTADLVVREPIGTALPRVLSAR